MCLMSSDEALSCQKHSPSLVFCKMPSSFAICPTGYILSPLTPKRLRCGQLLGSLELFLDQQCLPDAVLFKSSLLVDAVMITKKIK